MISLGFFSRLWCCDKLFLYSQPFYDFERKCPTFCLITLSQKQDLDSTGLNEEPSEIDLTRLKGQLEKLEDRISLKRDYETSADKLVQNYAFSL